MAALWLQHRHWAVQHSHKHKHVSFPMQLLKAFLKLAQMAAVQLQTLINGHASRAVNMTMHS